MKVYIIQFSDFDEGKVYNICPTLEKAINETEKIVTKENQEIIKQWQWETKQGFHVHNQPELFRLYDIRKMIDGHYTWGWKGKGYIYIEEWEMK